MPYKPNFCCECGEKIDKENLKWWESRRFCHECTAHFDKFSKRIGKYSFAAFALIGVGIIGGSSIAEKNPPVVLTQNQSAASSSQQSVKTPTQPAPVNSPIATKPIASNAPQAKAQTLTAAAAQPNAVQNFADATETVYFCGARTQKGAPCTRRVRGGGRCWQHVGKPAMLPPEKLKIAQ